MTGMLKLAVLCMSLSFLYFIAAKLGLSLAFEQGNTSPVWPPTGIAIAAIIYFGQRVWPGIFLGALLVNATTTITVFASLFIALGNTLEAIIAGYLIIKYTARYPFNNLAHIARFIVILIMATMVSATFGVTTLYLSQVINLEAYGLLWLTWWLGDLVGGTVFVPFLLTWSKLNFRHWSVSTWCDVALQTFVTLFCLSLVFSPWFPLGKAHYPLAFIYLPIAIWVSYRFQLHGATLFVLVVSAFAILGTLGNLGPFVRSSTNESLLLLQGFMGVMMVTTLSLAASIRERKLASKQLELSQDQLKKIVAQQTGDLKSAAYELRLAETVFNESSQSIIITDKDAKILRVNPSFTRLTGYTEAEVRDKNPRFLKSGRQSLAFYKSFWKSLVKTGNWQGEIWNKRKNGEIFPAWQTVTAVRNKKGKIRQYISILNDISERKTTEERIYHLAHYDEVTGLHNRGAFLDQLKKSISHAKRHQQKLAVLYLDLDNFKLINDASGHTVGDLLLRNVATRIDDTLRQEDIVARLGGDEFVILLTDIATNQDAAVTAEKVLAVMGSPMTLGNTEVVVTGSLGISIFPDNGESADTLLTNADVAMYKAKDKGRNNFQFFTHQMNALAQERLILEHEMRKGLENNEFILHFQPQVCVKTGHIIGCEALLRWQHPTRGMISPAVFIPIAEDSGLIRQLGAWVMRSACLQQKHWQEANLPELRMAINISGKQLVCKQLITEMQNILRETGIKPHTIELELTESTLMENVDENIDILCKLHDMGVQLAIDDFGTGYSSMAYLKRFPIDKLKIDQSFVRDIATDPDDAAIVNATTLLSHSLNMHVIAEGVETEQQLEFLIQIGCDEIQGYYFSKPLPAKELVQIIKEKRNLSQLACKI